MQSALSKLRAQEDKERNSRRIAGSREKNQDEADESRANRGSQSGDMDRMGYASGAQKSTPSSGKASARLRSTPYDAGIEGQRRGR
ncbi:hypothetical protein, partial [Klebsiella pneumoniae]|uniref:hypothetical protein n=1 Tax=Klebsiella pneumoniae TaxID=573 RepID=UPI0013306D47